MVAVTDKHSAYFALNFLDHQVCLAHLLRELEYLTELDPTQNGSKDVAGLLRKAIHERNEHPADVIEKKAWLEKLDILLQANLLYLKDHFERMRKGSSNAETTYSTFWRLREYHLTTMPASGESEN